MAMPHQHASLDASVKQEYHSGMKLLSKFLAVPSLGTIGILFAFGFGGWAVNPYVAGSSPARGASLLRLISRWKTTVFGIHKNRNLLITGIRKN